MNSAPVLQEENILWTVISTIASFKMNRTDLTFLFLLKTQQQKKPQTNKKTPGARVVT